MSITVAQKTDSDHRQKTLRDPKKCLSSKSPQNEYPLSRPGKTTRHRDSAELRTTQRQELLPHQNTQGASSKYSKVLSTTLSPTPKHFNCQSAQNHEMNNSESSASECASSHFVLPDPCQPPADQDNTSLWIAVMSQKGKTAKSQKKKAVNPRPQAPSTVAPSAGSRGTSDYENFLIKLSITLERCVQHLAGPDDHSPLRVETGHRPVKKHVKRYEGKAAVKFAKAMKVFPLSNPNESQLCHFLTMRIFYASISLEPQTDAQPQMAFDQKAIVQKTEHNNSFSDYSISEIISGLADIRHMRLSPKERLEVRSVADTPNLLPAAKDLHGRCDMAFGVNHMCLHLQSRHVGSDLPCYDPSAGVCCIWLRVELKKLFSTKYNKAALHQWAVGAYQDLSSRVRLARDETLDSFLSDPESIKDLRQYGYIICGARVDIWEMCVTHHQGVEQNERRRKRRNTYYSESYHKFPTRKLVTLELDVSEQVTHFCQWHAKIMDWGFHVYSRRYLENVERLRLSKLPAEKWALSYEDGIGQPLPSLLEEEPESCKS